MHLLLDAEAAAIDESALSRWTHVHRLQSRYGHGLVAVRPDGYVGFRCGTADSRQLAAWLDRVGAR